MPDHFGQGTPTPRTPFPPVESATISLVDPRYDVDMVASLVTDGRGRSTAAYKLIEREDLKTRRIWWLRRRHEVWEADAELVTAHLAVVVGRPLVPRITRPVIADPHWVRLGLVLLDHAMCFAPEEVGHHNFHGYVDALLGMPSGGGDVADLALHAAKRLLGIAGGASLAATYDAHVQSWSTQIGAPTWHQHVSTLNALGVSMGRLSAVHQQLGLRVATLEDQRSENLNLLERRPGRTVDERADLAEFWNSQ